MKKQWLTHTLEYLKGNLMTEKLRCYVINLDSSTKRLEEFNASFNKTNLNIERISAVDGRLIDIDAFSDDNLCKRQMGRGLQPGEVGCYLSHKKAIEQFLIQMESQEDIPPSSED